MSSFLESLKDNFDKKIIEHSESLIAEITTLLIQNSNNLIKRVKLVSPYLSNSTVSKNVENHFRNEGFMASTQTNWGADASDKHGTINIAW